MSKIDFFNLLEYEFDCYFRKLYNIKETRVHCESLQQAEEFESILYKIQARIEILKKALVLACDIKFCHEKGKCHPNEVCDESCINGKANRLLHIADVSIIKGENNTNLSKYIS